MKHERKTHYSINNDRPDDGDFMCIAGQPDVKISYPDTIPCGGIRFKNAYSARPVCLPAQHSTL